MIIKPLSISRLKQLFLELLINKTDKVSDISDNSVLNGVAYGNAKVAQKCLKDIAVVESQIMPDSASGTDLDNAATLFSSISRNSTSNSSTYLRVVADEGTFYDKTLVSFTNYNGIVFTPEEDLTIDSNGYGYVQVRSQDTGLKSNVSPNSIITINNEPTGHKAVTNEYMALGGSDNESDELFRKRIKQHTNIVARYTQNYYTQIFRQFNSNILQVMTMGINEDGEKCLGVVTQNGSSLLESELSELLDLSSPYFSIRDLSKFGNVLGVKLVNVDWYYVGEPGGNGTGVDFRVQLWSNYDADEVRRNIQINLTKYLDFRYWNRGDKVEWDDMLQIVKDTEGVRYVPDGYFNPSKDEKVPVTKLPRIRKFVMRDLDGNVISDNNGVLSPVFYPNNNR